MNVAQLEGAQLDYWVARAEGRNAALKHACGADWCEVDAENIGAIQYQPTQNWHIAAPIAERQRYLIYPRLNAEQKLEWLAEAHLNPDFHGMFVDASPVVAICRLRVAEVFGQQVSE